MKKKFTFLSVLLMTASMSYAQNKLVLQEQNAKPVLINTEINKTKDNNFTAKADGDVIFQSDFSVAADWQLGVVPGTGLQGQFVIGNNISTAMGQYMGSYTPTGGKVAFFDGIQYLVARNVNNQDAWIAVANDIDFSSTTLISISFNQHYRAFNTDNTYIEFSADGGATWTSTELNADVPGNANGPKPMMVDMIIPANVTNGKIRFRWESQSTSPTAGSGYGWAISDLVIKDGFTNNVALTDVFPTVGQIFDDFWPTYTKVPVGQAGSANKVAFGATVKNTGKVTQDITLEVTPQGGTTISSTPKTVASMQSDSVSILEANGYTIPTTEGTYNFDIELTTGTTLAETGDDTAQKLFSVTKYIYATDAYNGAGTLTSTFTGWASTGADEPQSVGTYFEIFEDQTLYGIDTYVANVPAADQGDYLGALLSGTIYEVTEGGYVEVDGTEEVSATATTFGKMNTLLFADPISLEAGKSYLVTVGGIGEAMLPIGTSGKIPAGGVAGKIGSNFARLAADGNSVIAPVVRLNFDPTLSAGKIEEANYSLNVYPNPFNTATEVAFELKNETAVSISVSDVAGRIVKTIDAKNYAAGANKVSIDGSNLNAGVYNVTIKFGNNVITKRIVKQ